jgi:hypothetical protein
MPLLDKFSRLMIRPSYNFKHSLHHQLYNVTDNGSIRNNLILQQGKTKFVSDSEGYESPRNIRQYTTMPQKQSWQSIWNSMSESDKLQSAMVSDQPPNAEVAYYKGLSYKIFGPEYSGHAMEAFRHALLLCGPKDATIKERCESELRILEAQNKTQVIPSEQLTQIHNEIDHLKDLILAVKKSVDQLVRKVDGV